jgi:hypothetical protein
LIELIVADFFFALNSEERREEETNDVITIQEARVTCVEDNSEGKGAVCSEVQRKMSKQETAGCI